MRPLKKSHDRLRLGLNVPRKREEASPEDILHRFEKTKSTLNNRSCHTPIRAGTPSLPMNSYVEKQLKQQ